MKRTLLVVLFLVFSASARADTVFTNFGSPGQTYYSSGSGSGYLIGQFFGWNDVIASPFVTSETATLTDVMLAVNGYGSLTTVYVESDIGGAPGTILDTLTTLGAIGGFGTPSILTYSCSACPQLAGGTEYFLVAGVASGGDKNWELSNNDTGTYYLNDSGTSTGPWEGISGTIPAFEVDGTPISTPEPSTLLLLSGGLIGLGFVKRKVFQS